MLFSSVDFAFFLPIVFILYWFVFRRPLNLRNLFLSVVSAIFYGWWDWRYLIMLAISSVNDFNMALLIERASNPSKRKLFLIISLPNTHHASTKGYKPLLDSVHVSKPEIHKLRKKIVHADPLDTKYFLKIVSLCETNNIQVILITPPESPAMPASEIDGQNVPSYCRKLADELNLRYYHFNQIGDFSNADYFRDYSHTNQTGTTYFSSSLARHLLMNNDFKEDLE